MLIDKHYSTGNFLLQSSFALFYKIYKFLNNLKMFYMKKVLVTPVKEQKKTLI